VHLVGLLIDYIPYFHLWTDPLYEVFPHFLINGTIFEKPLPKTKCVFWFSLQLLSETFLILRRNKRDKKKCILVFMWSTLYSCLIVMKLEFFQQIFEKSSNIKFHKNPSSGLSSCSMRTDRRTDMTKLIVAFRNFAKAPKKCCYEKKNLCIETRTFHRWFCAFTQKFSQSATLCYVRHYSVRLS
jgi:hypothetical protein